MKKIFKYLAILFIFVLSITNVSASENNKSFMYLGISGVNFNNDENIDFESIYNKKKESLNNSIKQIEEKATQIDDRINSLYDTYTKEQLESINTQIKSINQKIKLLNIEDSRFNKDLIEYLDIINENLNIINNDYDIINKKLDNLSSLNSESIKEDINRFNNNLKSLNDNYELMNDYLTKTINSNDSGSNDNSEQCEYILGDPTDSQYPAYWFQLILDIMKYIAIIALLGLSTMDFFKAIVADDKDALKKALVKTIKRFIYCVLLFFLPILVNVLMKILGAYGTCNLG